MASIYHKPKRKEVKTPMSTATKATQLQAKDRDGGYCRYPMNYDSLMKADIDWLVEFANENLNVNPSLSVVLRAALSHYRSYLQGRAASLRGLEDLTEFIQSQRDLMFTVSGRPEKARDRRYMTNE
jgi:hypothetical protein